MTELAAQQPSRLRITEIFFSLQGETRSVGMPTVFVRLTGCPLRCGYCDTAYAFSGGEWQLIAEIRKQVASYGARYVTVTGGEPLAQKASLELLTQLCDDGYEVSLETSGAIDISGVDSRVVRVVDIKTPGSGEVTKNLYSNLALLTAIDQIKFVICDAADYQWCLDTMSEYQLSDKCEILFSPSHEQLPAAELAAWVLRDKLPVRMQIQLHKYLWGNQPGC
jgi:7-carboxy-7-deazaguanine synthase